MLAGENNPSKRLEVREKLKIAALKRGTICEDAINRMKDTKIRKNIYQFFVNKRYLEHDKFKRGSIERLMRYIEYLENRSGPHARMIRTLNELIFTIGNRKAKPRKPAKRREKSKEEREKINLKISLVKKGTKSYYNPETLECRFFRKDERVPEGWVKGLIKNTPNNMATEEARKKVAEGVKRYRANETGEQKAKRLSAYHETISKRRENTQ